MSKLEPYMRFGLKMKSEEGHYRYEVSNHDAKLVIDEEIKNIALIIREILCHLKWAAYGLGKDYESKSERIALGCWDIVGTGIDSMGDWKRALRLLGTTRILVISGEHYVDTAVIHGYEVTDNGIEIDADCHIELYRMANEFFKEIHEDLAEEAK